MRTALRIEAFGAYVADCQFPEQWLPEYGSILALQWEGKLTLFRCISMTSTRLIVIPYETEN